MKKYKSIKLVALSLKERDLYKIYNLEELKENKVTAYQRRMKEVQEIRNYYQISSSKIQYLIENTVKEMERRLDIILVRMNLVISLEESRQKISHGLVKVNDLKIRSNQYLLKEGDKVEILGQQSNYNEICKAIIHETNYLLTNHSLGIGIYLRTPFSNEISTPI